MALIPTVLHRIPLAALAAMLVYTGFRLAHPREFLHVYRTGREQLVIFVTTLIAVLATDLLIGIAIGIAVKFVIHLLNGVPVRSLFKANLDVEPQTDNSCVIRAHHSAVFSNWIPFRRRIEDIGLVRHQNVIIDLSDTKFVDHSVMASLHELQSDFEQEGLSLTLTGLDAHRPLSNDQAAARKRGIPTVQRITIIADDRVVSRLEERLSGGSAIGYSSVPFVGSLNGSAIDGSSSLYCLQAYLVNGAAEDLQDFVRSEIVAESPIRMFSETLKTVELGNASAASQDGSRLSLEYSSQTPQ